MAKTLKDLFLALLNATIILIALCLFLGWKLAATVDHITDSLADDFQIVAPLREEVQGVRGELTALRSELSALSSLRLDDVTADGETAQKLSEALEKLNGLEREMQAAQVEITNLIDAPDQLINTAIENTADIVADRILAIRGCAPAS